MRAGAAALVLTLPALGVWVGATLAAGQVALPATLHSYAGSLASRALLAAWLAHACMFALRYSAGRQAKMVLARFSSASESSALRWCCCHRFEVRCPAAMPSSSRTRDPSGTVRRWTLIDV
jgi:hypothetical protein